MALLQNLRHLYCYSPFGHCHKLQNISFPTTGISNIISFSGYLHRILSLLCKSLSYFGLSENWQRSFYGLKQHFQVRNKLPSKHEGV